jgi:trans-AT polyketide synthase/acyltransferase/oxidoreductase domain-containing protein
LNRKIQNYTGSNLLPKEPSSIRGKGLMNHWEDTNAVSARSGAQDALWEAASSGQIPSPLFQALDDVRASIWIQQISHQRTVSLEPPHNSHTVAQLPGLYPEFLGDPLFCKTHATRFPYVVGEMANGIATSTMVLAAAQHGLLGFLGTAGLSPQRVHAMLDEVQQHIGTASYGANLIHTPQEPSVEESIVDVLIARKVQRVSASAYTHLTPALVRYALNGTRKNNGIVVRQNHVFAKVSRPEVAAVFLQPPPSEMVQRLLMEGKINDEEAACAAHMTVATAITVEADSGGHTDNQALTCVFPVILELQRKIAQIFPSAADVMMGAAGGLGDPAAIAAAFTMGAAYVVTGSVNQSALESGLAPSARRTLESVRLGDVTMAPAADMFEMGVKVQVMKRGSLFAQRAHKLYDVYRRYESIYHIPDDVKKILERDILRCSLQEAWESTKSFFQKRDPEQIMVAEKDPKHQMALVFRSYLGQASKWAISGEDSRAMDYQIWTGPALAAFNVWSENTPLEKVDNRTVGQIALNLLEGACRIIRAQQLRSMGVYVPAAAFRPRPEYLELDV